VIAKAKIDYPLQNILNHAAFSTVLTVPWAAWRPKSSRVVELFPVGLRPPSNSTTSLYQFPNTCSHSAWTENRGIPVLKDKNRFFEIALRSALEWAAFHDRLLSFEAVDFERNRVGKARPKRFLSMLPRMVRRTVSVSQGLIECQYRDAEYDYEK
jgi:hypothetical protein